MEILYSSTSSRLLNCFLLSSMVQQQQWMNQCQARVSTKRGNMQHERKLFIQKEGKYHMKFTLFSSLNLIRSSIFIIPNFVMSMTGTLYSWLALHVRGGHLFDLWVDCCFLCHLGNATLDSQFPLIFFCQSVFTLHNIDYTQESS